MNANGSEGKGASQLEGRASLIFGVARLVEKELRHAAKMLDLPDGQGEALRLGEQDRDLSAGAQKLDQALQGVSQEVRYRFANVLLREACWGTLVVEGVV